VKGFKILLVPEQETRGCPKTQDHPVRSPLRDATHNRQFKVRFKALSKNGGRLSFIHLTLYITDPSGAFGALRMTLGVGGLRMTF
jgi:hypothetical protein